jgi:hypothetical protein
VILEPRDDRAVYAYGVSDVRISRGKWILCNASMDDPWASSFLLQCDLPGEDGVQVAEGDSARI